MFEQSKRQVDSDLARSMNLFERSEVGQVTPIAPKRPTNILLALDSSSQDLTAIDFARELRDRHGCDLHGLVFSRFSDATPDSNSMTGLSDLGIEPIANDDRENFEQVLEAVHQTEADLLVLPCPFGRDFDSVGGDSTGTVIDILVARCPIPFLVVRKPFESSSPALDHVRLILTDENAAATTAAASAVGLLNNNAKMELLLLIEASYFENVRETMHELKPEMEISYEDLEGALAKTFARLHTSLQKTAAEHNFKYKLLVRHEDETEYSLSITDDAHQKLFVLALERGDHRSEAQVHDFIRRSAHPVLIDHVGSSNSG